MTAPIPARGRPERIPLEGRYVRLEPLAEAHVPSLYAAASAPGADQRFAYLFSHPPGNEADMARWVTTAAVKDDPLMFAVVDRDSGRAGGYQAMMRIVPEHGVVEIGSIMWGPAIARTRRATEALFLFACHAFDALGYRRFEWKCNTLNEPSKRAARRFGFTYEGTFRQHMIVKGQNRDTAWFAMLDGDWPRIKAEYERWLDPANFGPDGEQKTRLALASAG
jgi:RimJ/RimL family protein N-acetyltransferase